MVERMACWALFSFFILSFLFSFFFFYSTLSLSLSLSLLAGLVSQFSGLPILPDGNWNRQRLFIMGQPWASVA